MDYRVFKYNIELSENDTIWVQIVDRAKNTIAGTVIDSFLPTKARFIIININSNETSISNNLSCEIFEIEVYRPTNLDLNSIVTSSSSLPFNSNLLLTDGDLSTKLRAENGNFPEWGKVDLGKIKPINCILTCFPESVGLAFSYQIAVSDNDSIF